MNMFPAEVIGGYVVAVAALACLGIAAWVSRCAQRRRGAQFDDLAGQLLANLSPEPPRHTRPVPAPTDLDRQFAEIIHATWGVRPAARPRPAPQPPASTLDSQRAGLAPGFRTSSILDRMRRRGWQW